jgi:hypothetical protein
MKEDVLEQIVDDYLQFNGYFTRHNVRFKPDPMHPDYEADQDRVSSDVDVVGYRPGKEGAERVVVVSCKAWQAGFNAGRKLAELRGERPSPKGKATWRHFRELWVPKWSEAFRKSVAELTGQDVFSYQIAVTRLVGEGRPEEWAADPVIKSNLPGCSIGFLVLEDMWSKMLQELTKTPASSEMGRLVQLLKAAGLTAPQPVGPPSPPLPGSDAAITEEVENEP